MFKTFCDKIPLEYLKYSGKIIYIRYISYISEKLMYGRKKIMDFLMGIWHTSVGLMNTFKISDGVDILIVACLIYGFIKLIQETRAEQLVKGIFILLIAYAISEQFKLGMLSTLLSNFFQFSFLAILVVFQPELRRALEHLGRSKIGNYWSLNYMIGDEDTYIQKIRNVANTIVDAVLIFQEAKVGALIVFERKTKLGEIIDTGTVIKAKPSIELISNIFYNKAPLHDGAMIVKDGLFYAGGCILPLTRNENLSNELGTRHRAAIGISENSDAVAVVVSEETGSISIAVNGKLKQDFNKETLKETLNNLLLQNNISYKSFLANFKKNKDNNKA